MAVITGIASSALGNDPDGVPFPGGPQMYGPQGTVIYLTMSGSSPGPGFGIIVYVYRHGTAIREAGAQSLGVGANPASIRLIGQSLTSGVKDFSVFDSGGESAIFSSTFELILPPTITVVSPDSASAGETVTLTGTNFRPEATVTVDGVSASGVTYIGPTSLTFTMPTLTSGLGSKSLVLTTDGGTADAFITYNGSVRVISVTPSALFQFVDTDVVVTGVGFTPECDILIDAETDGETACTNINFVDSTEMECTVPGLAKGTHQLRVVSPTDGSGNANITVIAKPLIRGAGVLVKYKLPAVAVPDATDNIVARGTRASAIVPRLAPPPNRKPYLYDASATGLAVSRNHYFQGFDTVEMLLEALAAGHEEDGTSVVSLAGLKSGTRITSSVVVSSSLAPVTTQLMAHGGEVWSAFQRFQSPEQQDEDGNILSFPDGDTAFVRVGLAFDDTYIYGVHKYTLGVPNGIQDFLATLDTYLFKPQSDALPTIGSRNYTNPAVEGNSWGAAAYQRELDNGTKLVGLYEAEHVIHNGNHAIPLDRFNGFSKTFDQTVSAPSVIGERALIEIEAAGTNKLFVQPTLVPESGSGIIQASMAFSRNNVYVSLKRLTAGSSDSVRLVVFKVSST